MKIILFCFSVLLAVISPTHSDAKNLLSSSNFALVHPKYQPQPLTVYSESENTTINDNSLVEVDDEINDNERKVIPFQKTLNKDVFYIDTYNTGKCLKKYRSTSNSIYLPSSLYILLSVFRI